MFNRSHFADSRAVSPGWYRVPSGHNPVRSLGLPGRRLTLGALTALAFAALFPPGNAQAQITYDAAHHAYFVTNAAISTDISGNEVFVGKDNATNFATLPPIGPLGPFRLVVQNASAKVTGFGNVYQGARYFGINVFGTHWGDLNGGSVSDVTGFDASTVNITGGSVGNARGYNTSTVNIWGGNVNQASGYDTSTLNINGAVLNAPGAGVFANDSSTVNLNSGTVGQLYASDRATVNLSAGSSGTVGQLYAGATSTVNVAGGNAFVQTSARATVNVSAGNMSYRGLGFSRITVSGGFATNFETLEGSTARITGGTVRDPRCGGVSLMEIEGGSVDDVVSFGSGTLNFKGGTATRVVDALGDSAMNISGGTVDYLAAIDRAVVTVTGGTIGVTAHKPGAGLGLIGKFGGSLKLYGSGIVLGSLLGSGKEDAGLFGFSTNGSYYGLTGTLLDGSPLNTTLWLADGQTFEGSLGGGSQAEALQPASVNGNAFAFENVPSGAWFDPPLADTFVFTMTDGNFFTDIVSLPVGIGDADGLFTVSVGGQMIGEFAEGQAVNFASAGFTDVTQFEISGIAPLVDTADPHPFPVQLAFSAPFASFTMTGVASAAPEPGALALIAAVSGCGLLALARRRRAPVR